MHDVVMHILRRDHQVADQLRVRRDLVVERVFNGPHRRDTMHQGANTADALREGPCLARVAPLENEFDTANHRARTVGAGNRPVAARFGLDAQMALDPGDGIDNDAFVHGVYLPCVIP